MVVVVIAAVAVIAVTIDAAWALRRGDHDDLLVLPVVLVIWLALGASAWRRNRLRARSGIRAL